VLAVLPGIIVGALVAAALKALYDRLLAHKKVGHVISCRGVRIMTLGELVAREKKQRVGLVFGNRVFAKLWASLNPDPAVALAAPADGGPPPSG